MFSRIFKSARSIVSPNPPTEPVTTASTAWKPIALPKTNPASTEEKTSPKTLTKVSTPRHKVSPAKRSPKNSISRNSVSKISLVTGTNPTPRRSRAHSSEMVTTRRQREAGRGELTDENLVNVSVPTGTSTKKSDKKRSFDSIEDVPSDRTPSRQATKKSKVAALPLRNKAANEPEEDTEQDTDTEAKNPVVEIPASKEITVEATKKDSNKMHKKFGSDDEGEGVLPVFSTARESQVDAFEQESSDEDDMPEEVGAQTAAMNAKVQAESARSAIESQRKARKEKAAKLQAQPKRKPIPQLPAEDDAENEGMSLSEIDDEASSIDVSEPEETVFDAIPPRRIKYQLDDVVVPKDRKIGLTTYRVTKAQNKSLAPKSSKNAQNMKETLLHSRGPKANLRRGQPKKSFL